MISGDVTGESVSSPAVSLTNCTLCDAINHVNVPFICVLGLSECHTLYSEAPSVYKIIPSCFLISGRFSL